MKRALTFLVASICFLGCVFGLTACENKAKIYTVYEITAEYVPETATLTGTNKVTFENPTDNALSVLKFQLYANAYRQGAKENPVLKSYQNAAYYQGESFGETVISSVTGAKSWEISGDDENILYVYLLNDLYPNESVVLDISFLVKLACVNHRTGVTEHTVNLANAVPVLCGMQDGAFKETAHTAIGDPFYQDCADFSVALTLPKDYVVAATGTIVKENVLESKREYLFSAPCVRDFAVVCSMKFKRLEKDVGGNVVEYYYYADDEAQKTLDVIAEAFTFFEKAFGEYPYARYAVAQTGLCYSGMEYPGLTMLSDALTGEAQVRSIVHETAHQWWGVSVGSDQIDNAWQDEGVAEYAALLFFEAYEKYGVSREKAVQDALKEYRSYYDVYGSVLGRTDTKMVRSLDKYVSEYEYKCLAFDKAVVMLDTLRKAVGERAFLDGLKEYYRHNTYGMARAEDFISAFERVGLDVNGFFESFLQGKAVL